jgi:predicted DNA-binding protein
MTEEKFEKLVQYAKREERERILGIIEFYIEELSDDTVAERFTKRILKQCVKIAEGKEEPQD